MEQKTLTAEERRSSGKGAARRLRRGGKIPAIVYGHGAPKPVAVDQHEFGSKFRTVSESSIIKLELDSGTHDVLIRDFQEDAVSGRVTHIDFYEIERGRTLRTRVGLHLAGGAIGVREGGLLESFVHELEVECLPKDLPEHIEHDITALELGHSLHVRDLLPPEGVKVLNPPDQVVCTVAHKRAEAVAAAEEEEVVEAEEAAIASEAETEE